jgi:molybdopterin molybdotransferase
MSNTISLSQALFKALEAVTPKQESAVVMLDSALGKVLAEDIHVRKNLPSFDNSAMDGYAFAYSDAGKELRVVQTIFAGEVPKAILKSGECYKIMTGAQVPSDADTIAPFEVCEEVNKTHIIPPKQIKQGANLRKKGEECLEGSILLKKGTLLESSHIALLAAQGITAIKVFLNVKVAVISSGNEIKEPWEEASEDEIYNANAFGITALLQSFGFDALYVGSIPDDFDATVSFLASISSYDVILTTGGISHGEADYLYEAFIKNGLTPLFHGINLKPGHPTMMGTMQDTFVMGLPGNPLTTMVIAHTLSVPVLFKMQGNSSYFHTVSYATLAHSLTFRPGRTTLVLGELQNGVFTPTRGGKVGSGMLTPLCESNAIAYFDETTSSVKEGTLIKVIKLNDTSRSDSFEALN